MGWCNDDAICRYHKYSQIQYSAQSAAKTPCKINAGLHTSSFGNAMLEVLLHHAFHRHEVPVAKPWILCKGHCHWWLMIDAMLAELREFLKFCLTHLTSRCTRCTCRTALTAPAFQSLKFHSSMSWVLVPTPQASSVAVQTYAPVPMTEKQYLGSPALWNIDLRPEDASWYHDVSTSHNFWTEITNSRDSMDFRAPFSKKYWIPWLLLPWHWYPLTSLEKELHRLHANQAKLPHPGTEVSVLSGSQHKSRALV